MPIRQRGTLFGVTLVAIPVLKKAMATRAEGLLDHIALIPNGCSGFVIPVRPDPNYDIPGKKVGYFSQHTCMDILNWACIYLADSDNKQNIWMFEV